MNIRLRPNTAPAGSAMQIRPNPAPVGFEKPESGTALVMSAADVSGLIT